MIRRIYIELTSDEIDALEKAEEIMSAVAKEIKAGTTATVSISDYDEELITSVAELGANILNHKDVFYTVY